MIRRVLVIVVVLVVLFLISSVQSANDDDIINLPDSDGGTAEATCNDDNKEKKFGSVLDLVDNNPFKFLKEQVFGQKSAEPSNRFLSMLDEPAGNNDGDGTGTDDDQSQMKENHSPFFGILDQLGKMNFFPENQKASLEQKQNEATGLVQDLLKKAVAMRQEETPVEGLALLNRIATSLKEAGEQLHNQFGDVLDSLDGYLPLVLVYYLQNQAQVFNPIWKRRMHRFFNKVARKELVQLHDALYLSALAYVDTLDHFRQGLSQFDNDSWELMFGTTNSLPDLPANFLLIHKELAPLEEEEQQPSLQSLFAGKKETEVVVVLVVRGTKDLSDAIADALLNPQEYKGGVAHGGILASGKNLAEYYLPKLKELRQASGTSLLLKISLPRSMCRYTLDDYSHQKKHLFSPRRTRQSQGNLHGS